MPERRPTPVLLTLALACVAFSLSQTLVVPALPSLAEEFDASPSTVSWVLTGFLVSASIATPIVGKLGDLFGKGRVLTAVLLLFSAGAVINALAGSIGVVIAGRVLQGVAGGVFPLAFGIVRDTFPREHIPGGLAMISAIFGIGGGIGLPLSGVIVDHVDLQWLFWINLIALPAAFAAHRLIPPSPPVPNARVDWIGAFVLAGGLAGILLGVSQGSEWGWGSPANVGAIAGGLALIGVFVVVEGRVAQPLIDLQVLRRRSVAATNLTGFMVGAAMFSSFLIMPQFAQAPEVTGYGFGFTVTEAGLLLMPTALAQLLAGAPATRIAARDRLPRAAQPRRGDDHGLVPDQHVRPRAPVGARRRRRPARRGHHVRVRGDGEPDRRRGLAVRGRHRDRDQHRDAHGRRLVRRRRGDRDPRGLRARDAPAARRGRLHRGVRVLQRGGRARAAGASRLVPRPAKRVSLEPARAGSR